VLLRAGSRHLTAAQLEQRLHTQGWPVDTSGIHRATGTLTDRGLLHTLSNPGPVAYGLAVPRHHHAICTGCGLVIEIAHDGTDDSAAATATIAAAAERMLRPFGFQPDPDGLTIHGRCRRCRDQPGLTHDDHT
jgi:Fe2+ or Zn2+ uptake regulation protein